MLLGLPYGEEWKNCNRKALNKFTNNELLIDNY